MSFHSSNFNSTRLELDFTKEVVNEMLHNQRILEAKIDEQATVLEQQSDLINRLFENMSEKMKEKDKEINCIRETVYQLISGLFCQTNQHKIINTHCNMLYGCPDNQKINTCREDIWPTTRLGNNHEKRLNDIQNVLNGMMEYTCVKNNNYTDYYSDDDEDEADFDDVPKNICLEPKGCLIPENKQTKIWFNDSFYGAY